MSIFEILFLIPFLLLMLKVRKTFEITIKSLIIYLFNPGKRRERNKPERFIKVLRWCEKKYKRDAHFFVDKHSHPDATELLITILSNAGSALYLRTCGVRAKKEGIKFSSKTPANILEVIKNDQYFLFMLGEDTKKIEILPLGNPKEMAVRFYKSNLEEHGLEKVWGDLKTDVTIFLHRILSEKDKKLKSS